MKNIKLLVSWSRGIIKAKQTLRKLKKHPTFCVLRIIWVFAFFLTCFKEIAFRFIYCMYQLFLTSYGTCIKIQSSPFIWMLLSALRRSQTDGQTAFFMIVKTIPLFTWYYLTSILQMALSRWNPIMNNDQLQALADLHIQAFILTFRVYSAFFSLTHSRRMPSFYYFYSYRVFFILLLPLNRSQISRTHQQSLPFIFLLEIQITFCSRTSRSCYGDDKMLRHFHFNSFDAANKTIAIKSYKMNASTSWWSRAFMCCLIQLHYFSSGKIIPKIVCAFIWIEIRIMNSFVDNCLKQLPENLIVEILIGYVAKIFREFPRRITLEIKYSALVFHSNENPQSSISDANNITMNWNKKFLMCSFYLPHDDTAIVANGKKWPIIWARWSHVFWLSARISL